MASSALPPGVADVRYVRSASEPGKEYRMIRTRGGWHHADATCPGFTERGECRHMAELNEHDTGVALVPIGGDPLAVVDELESAAIIESLAGNVSPTWIYQFPQGASTVTGLSAVGVDQAARYMATKGEVLRIIDCHIEHEDDREARFFAVAGRYAVSGDGRQVLLDTAPGAKRQPKYIRLKTGGEQFNDSWYEIGVTKATRNAKAKLLSDEVRQYIIAEATKRPGAARTVVQGTPAPKKGETVIPKAQPAPAPAPKADADGVVVEEGQTRCVHDFQEDRTGAVRCIHCDAHQADIEKAAQATEAGQQAHAGIGAETAP